MSAYDGYDDETRRYRSVRTRTRERDEPDYIREETYIERGKGQGPRGAELVYRGREESIEDIPRDFPPPGRRSTYREYDEHDVSRRPKSMGGRRYSGDYDDDRYSGYTAPSGRQRDRDYRRSRDDRDYDLEYSRSPPRKDERRKSGVGNVLDGLGLGGLVSGLVGGTKDKQRSRSESRGARSVRSRSRIGSRRGYSPGEDDRAFAHGDDRAMKERKWAQAAQAALVAGAVEAFRSRKEPGPWSGDKGKRIATAALGAGGIDGLIDRNPEKKSKRHLAEAVIGGLAASRIANGSRSKSRGPDFDSRDPSPDSYASRSRSRSRSVIDRFRGRSQSRGRGGDEGGGGGGGALKGLMGAGAVAAAGKAIYNRVRSKSRKRRSPSNSSADSYVPSRTRRLDRRRSPRSDIGSARWTDEASGREIGPVTRSRSLNNSRALTGAGAPARGNVSGKGGGGGDAASDSSSSTTDMEKTRKHMRGKKLITTGFATVATIHAAHGVYSSMEAHEKRHRLVAEGEMSPEDARKKQTKAWIQDAAAVGIAALGIKGAFSEWKEMNEQRREISEIEKRKTARRKKRVARQKQEERDRHERMMSILERHPQLAIGHSLNQTGIPLLTGPQMQGSAAYPPPPDLSGNPYAPRASGR